MPKNTPRPFQKAKLPAHFLGEIAFANAWRLRGQALLGVPLEENFCTHQAAVPKGEREVFRYAGGGLGRRWRNFAPPLRKWKGEKKRRGLASPPAGL